MFNKPNMGEIKFSELNIGQIAKLNSNIFSQSVWDFNISATTTIGSNNLMQGSAVNPRTPENSGV